MVAGTGGTESNVGGYHYHLYLTSGTFTVTEAGQVELFMLGGGGGGGGYMGGGGGAGGAAWEYYTFTTTGAKTVTVGAGGTGGSISGGTVTAATNGGASSLPGSNAAGGGAGGARFSSSALSIGHDGASGGGGGAYPASVQAGGANLQNTGVGGDGGDAGGGGGGAWINGADASVGIYDGAAGGNGANDAAQLFTDLGLSGVYAGGGGGGAGTAGVGGTGGTGGAGDGGSQYGGTDAVANTGSGGGGAGWDTTNTGGDGASGIVIIRYAPAGFTFDLPTASVNVAANPVVVHNRYLDLATASISLTANPLSIRVLLELATATASFSAHAATPTLLVAGATAASTITAHPVFMGFLRLQTAEMAVTANPVFVMIPVEITGAIALASAEATSPEIHLNPLRVDGATAYVSSVGDEFTTELGGKSILCTTAVASSRSTAPILLSSAGPVNLLGATGIGRATASAGFPKTTQIQGSSSDYPLVISGPSGSVNVASGTWLDYMSSGSGNLTITSPSDVDMYIYNGLVPLGTMPGGTPFELIADHYIFHVATGVASFGWVFTEQSNITIEIHGSTARTPCSVTVTGMGFLALEAITVTLAGTVLKSANADSMGVYSHSIDLPALDPGTYFLRVDGVSGTAETSFTVFTNAGSFDPVTDDDLPPEVTGKRWVLHDPASTGIPQLIFPRNPETTSSPFAPRSYAADTTTSPDGQVMVWEGGTKAQQWTFSGRLDDKATLDGLVAYFNLNRRFYLIDHRSQAWVVTFAKLDVTPIRQAGHPWAHKYEVTALLFRGPITL